MTNHQVTFDQIKSAMLMQMNELTFAHKAATAETWPMLRDEVLERYGAKGSMDNVVFSAAEVDEENPTVH